MDLVKISCCCLISVVIRWAVSMFPYSGYNKPPMFGDYEAQRHWMEVTYHLKPTDWYHNTEQNNLQYWGLDYPPLTAYHSKLMGAIAHLINPKWVPLNVTVFREAVEDSDTFHDAHKLFMRYSVLIVDMLIYIPAVIVYHILYDKSISSFDKHVSILLTLIYPGLVLIDHGHFQYNCVSLGLFLWAVVILGKGYDILASVLFCCALNYKQMELYHALPFFFYLLSRCYRQSSNVGRLKKLYPIAIAVLVSFAVCWYPFITDKDEILQVLHRLFPFKRGVFEDKVANVWCMLSSLPLPFLKLKTLPIEVMSTVSLITTAIFASFSSIHLFKHPTFRNFKLSLVNVALIFFLFSFQVHEKSILIVAVPVCLLLSDKPLMCSWFLIISTTSMFPLLMRDHHSITCMAMQFIFFAIAILRFMPYIDFIHSYWLLYVLSLLGGFVLCLLCQFITPPTRYPDLWPVAISVYCCLHFLFFVIYFHHQQLFVPDKNKSAYSHKNQ